MVQNPVADDGVTVGIGADATGFNEAVDGAIDQLSSLKGAAGIAGGAIAALGVKMGINAVNAASKFESSIIDLQKVAGEDVAAGLEDTIQQMAEEIPLTAEELAGLATEAARFGIEGEENIQQFVESTAKMATATTLSTNQASEAFAKLSQLTGAPIENVENLGSSINTLSNNFATNSQEIVDASLRSSGALSSLGLKQTEIFGLNAALNEASEGAERAGSRLRRLAQELVDADPEAFGSALGMMTAEFERMREENPRQVIQKMAETMKEGGEAADVLREELSTTSRQALSGLAQNLEGVTEANQTASESFEKGSSIQSEFAQESEKTATQQELLRSKINNVKRSLGEDLLPAFNSTIDTVSAGVDTFSAANDATDGWLAKLTLVGSVVGGAATAIAVGINAVGGMTAITTAASTAAAGLGTALTVLTGPVGLLAAGVGALGAAWSTNFLGIRDITYDAADGISRRISDLANWLDVRFGDDVGAVLDETGMTFNVLSNDVSNAMDTTESAVNRGLTFIRNNFGREIQAVKTITQTGFRNIKVLAKTGIGNVIDLVSIGLSLLRRDWDGAMAGVENITDRTVGGVEQIFRNGLNAVNKITGGGVDNVKKTLKALSTWVTSKWDFAGKMREELVADLDGALSTIKTWVEKISNALSFSPDIDLPDIPSFGGDEGDDDGSSSSDDDGGEPPSAPGISTGGFVDRAGMAMIHAGERVVPSAQVSDRGKVDIEGSGGLTIENLQINASDRDSGRRAGKAFRDELRRFDI